MQDSNFTQGNLLSHKVYVDFNVLGPAVLYWVS
jgi:hypothetical protein